MSKKGDSTELDVLEVAGVGLVRPGMELEHPKFGVGVVEAIYEFVKSKEVIIRIDFKKYGSKALVPEFAKLSLPTPRRGLLSKLFKVGS